MARKSRSPELDARITLHYHYNRGVKSGMALHRLTGIPLSTIYDNLKKIKRGKGPERRVKTVAHHKLSGRDRQRLVRLALLHPRWSSSDLANEIAKRGSPSVSPATVYRYLIRAKIYKLRPTKVPPLTAAHKKKRVEWCRQNLNRNWSNVVFTDESYVRLFASTLKLWSKSRPKAKTYAHPPQVLIWAGISAQGTTPVKIDCGSVDQFRYQDILQECLIETMSTLYPDGFLLMHDNAKPHIAKTTMSWLEHNGIEVLDWPPMSPDLNPIENLWAIIKKRIEKLDPSTKSDLKEVIEEIWNGIDHELIKSLIKSMKKRLQECIAKEGEKIDY